MSAAPERAGLGIAITLLAALLIGAAAGPGHTIDWIELGLIGGAAGAALTFLPYVRLLGAKRPFWTGVAALALFMFWFCAAFTANTAGAWGEPLERGEGRVIAKRIAKGRSTSHLADLATARGSFTVSTPKDVWEEVRIGQNFAALICRGLLGYPYVVTPLDRSPYLDLPGLLGLRAKNAGLSCR